MSAHPRTDGALALLDGFGPGACPHGRFTHAFSEWIAGYAACARLAAVANVSVLSHVKQPRDGARWMPAEKAFVAAAWPLDGLPCRRIARLLRREERAVRIKASRMGLEKRRQRRAA